MKKALTLALLGALAVSPALARGQMEQRGELQGGQRMGQTDQQSQRASLDRQTTRQLQMQLGQMGYDSGPADGIMGPQTRSALSNFQRDQNLPETGRPDRQTLSALGVESDTQQAQTPEQRDQRRSQQQQQQDEMRQQDQDTQQQQRDMQRQQDMRQQSPMNQ